jgi:hypothetical protein
LQIVEEQRERVFGSCEYANEPPEEQLETALGVLRWKLWDRRLLSYDEFQFRDKIDDELAVRI